MLDKTTKGIIAEGDPRSLKTNSRNPFVCRFFNRQPPSMDARGSSDGLSQD
jgi:hypothetical protein